MAGDLKLLHIPIFLLVFFPYSAIMAAPGSRSLLQDQGAGVVGSKCGNCPCDTPCNPPPSPPPPPPPPVPVKPPPTPTPSSICPPPPTQSGGWQPPSPPYVYINSPPGNIYQVYPYYSGVKRSRSLPVAGILAALVTSMLAVAI